MVRVLANNGPLANTSGPLFQILGLGKHNRPNTTPTGPNVMGHTNPKAQDDIIIHSKIGPLDEGHLALSRDVFETHWLFLPARMY